MIIWSLGYVTDEADEDTYEKYIKKFLIWTVICWSIAIMIPDKKTSYTILGVSAAVEMVKESDALQQLPEKSFEALNRLLDSVAPEEEKESSK